MTAQRMMARLLLGWSGLVLLVLTGLLAFFTGVEAVTSPQTPWAALLRLPTLICALLPAAVAAGSALGALSMQRRTEGQGLAACGVGPRQLVGAVFASGLLIGLLGAGAQLFLVPGLEGAADLRGGASTPAWLRLDAGGYRPVDGLLVPIVDGVAQAPQRLSLPEAELEIAQDALQPARARAASLIQGQARSLVIERWTRLGRGLACALLGLTLLTPSRRDATVGLGLGLLYVAVELWLRLAAQRGLLPPSLGGMGAAGLLTLSQAWRYSTWIQ